MALIRHHERGAGPAVVLLHGFPLTAAMWSAQIDPLTAAGFRVVMPDLRGHGESPAPDEVATMTRHAEDVIALLDRLGLERVILGGLSLGGYVALELYRRHPRRIAALVLLDTRAEADTPEGRRGRRETVDRIREDGIGVLESSMLPKLLTNRSREERGVLTERVRGMMRATTARAAIRTVEGLAERPDQRELLPTITVPTLVAVGAEDPITPPAVAEAMASAIPGAGPAVVIPDAAHLMPLEAAEAFNPFLLEFLRGVSPSLPRR